MTRKTSQFIVCICSLKSFFIAVVAVAQLGALCFTPAHADQADFTTTIKDGQVTITGYTGLGGDVVIPSTINGLPVSSLGKGAFKGSTTITSLTIPNSVTSIGAECFRGASLLSKVNIPPSITDIDALTFAGCRNLTSVTISAGVKTIGSGAFESTGLTSVIIPETVLHLSNTAFAKIPTLTSVVFEGNAPEIDRHPFKGAAPSFTIYYQASAKGFTSPKWTDAPGDVFTTMIGAPPQTDTPTPPPPPPAADSAPTSPTTIAAPPASDASPIPAPQAPVADRTSVSPSANAAPTTTDTSGNHATIDPIVGRYKANGTVFTFLPTGTFTASGQQVGSGRWKCMADPGESDPRYQLVFQDNGIDFIVKLSADHQKVFDDNDPFSNKLRVDRSVWPRMTDN